MALVDDYENAVKAGNTQLADYLAKAVAFQYGGINPANVTAAPASLLPNRGTTSTLGPWQIPSLSQALDAITQGIFHPFNTVTGSNIQQMNKDVASGQGPVTSTVKGAAAAFNFITDIPRVTTTVLGLILIIAGIFALSQGAAARVIVNTLHSNATS